MIINPNPNNFYSSKEMLGRENYIPTIKKRILDKLSDLKGKINKEIDFPEKQISIDDLSEIEDEIDNILNKWNY